MADFPISFISGTNALRPVTNAKCVMLEGVGSVFNKLNKDAIQVPLGIIAQGSITSASKYTSVTLSGMKTSVVMREPFVVPYVRATFNIHIDSALEGLKIKIYYGYNRGMSSTTSNVSEFSSDYLEDGESFAFPSDAYGVETGYDTSRGYYRIGFFSQSLQLSADDIREYIRLGYIAITYKEMSGNVVARNQRATEIIEVSKTFSSSTPHHRNFVFTHISDLHASGIALNNALKYSEAINSQGLFITGDVVAQSSNDGYGYVYALAKDYDFPSFVTSGNHDGVGQALTAFNAEYFGSMATEFGYTRRSSSVGYYYKDLTIPKIRIIALDCSDSANSYRIGSVRADQLSWLGEALNGTPSGFGVIIILHQPVGNLTAASKSANPSFARHADIASSEVNWTGAADIRSAVDSFISNGGEFIMYACGHMHMDIAGVIDGTTNRQLMMCIDSPNGNQDMQNDVASLGDAIGKAQDLFNAYIIDRVKKTVRIVRIGANVDENLQERLVEQFQYAVVS